MRNSRAISEQVRAPICRHYTAHHKVSAIARDLQISTSSVYNAFALVVAVPSSFAEEYIATRFKGILDEELRSLLSPTAEVRLVIGRVAQQF